ncbi:MAG TPA: phosphotransferase [Acidimicrobiales bacterium]|nr:phosphotransferase [Acidimicrobiales bacterium]
MSAPTADIPSLPDLLEASGLGAPFQVEPLPGGRNNQVFQVTLPQLGRSVVLKSYFHGPSEPRDRAGAEWAFARFAWASGLRCIAQPLAWSPSAHCALFDFLPGVPVEPGALGAGEVAQALAFVLDLNRHRAVGGQLPLAAEACFSFSEHVELVRRRLRRLSGLAGHDPLTRQVHRFVHEEAEPALERVVAEGRLSLAGAHLDPTAPVPHERRCISPSDFGFHNALRGPDGTIYFFDFEYAGWDDPAKLVADFFNQIAVPVPPEHYRRS